MEVDLRALECQRAKAEAGARVQQEKIHADTTADLRRALALRHVSWRSSFTAISPVFFAILVAVFMFLFWKWKQPDAAAAFEKILVMVITGGLGWAAGRTQYPGQQPPGGPGGSHPQAHRRPPLRVRALRLRTAPPLPSRGPWR